MRLRKFEDHLHEQLRDPEFARHYLEAAREDGIEELLYAIRDVAAAQDGGFTAVAEKVGVGRTSLYKSLSKGGNPSLRTVDNVLAAMGLTLCIGKAESCAADTRP